MRVRRLGRDAAGRGALRRAVAGGAAALLVAGTVQVAAAEEGAAPPPTCAPPSPGAPMFVTESCVDPRFNDGYAFIDVDEVRSAPLPHRVVQGGFRGTDLRFVYYFPAAEEYEDRFIQGPVHQLRLTGEVASPQEIRAAFDAGAYLVETNNGGTDVCLVARDGARGKCDPTIVGYRANAAAAKFSRVVAQRVYGTEDRPYGYIYGGSGGAYMSLASMENTKGVWDGAVPFVMGDPQALVAHFSIRSHALRVIGPKMAAVVDAMEPGGSGDPYATLDEDQKAALREVTRFGYPLRGWYDYKAVERSTLTVITSDYVKLLDPTYVDDFWSKPGYLGTEASRDGDAIRAARVRHDATVLAAVPAKAPAPVPGAPVPPSSAYGPAYPYVSVAQYAVAVPPNAFVLDSLPDPGRDLLNASLVVTSGPARGQSCPLNVLDAGRRLVQCGPNSDPEIVNAIAAGDTVRIDNSFWLAFQTQPRHELAPEELEVYSYDQYRTRKGEPRYPQRSVKPGLFGTTAGAGAVTKGRFHGKMMVMNTMLDVDAYPFPADWYRERVVANMGKKAAEQNLRTYFFDNATHGGGAGPRTVSYLPGLQQALRDLAAWVEEGTEPPADTGYTVDGDNQVQLAPTAAQRKGIQPVVDLRVAGGKRIEAGVGQPVELTAVVEAAPGTDKVVCVEWSPEGKPFQERNPLSGVAPADPAGILNGSGSGSSQACDVDPAERVTATRTHTYTQAGTYYAMVRGTTHRSGDPDAEFARVQNLDRVRVVVR